MVSSRDSRKRRAYLRSTLHCSAESPQSVQRAQVMILPRWRVVCVRRKYQSILPHLERLLQSFRLGSWPTSTVPYAEQRNCRHESGLTIAPAPIWPNKRRMYPEDKKRR